MTNAERIALEVLVTYSGPYYVAGTDTQRARVLGQAAEHIRSLIEAIEREAARNRAAANPS